MINFPSKVLLCVLALNLFLAPIVVANARVQALSAAQRNDVQGGVAWCAVLKVVWVVFEKCMALYTGWEIVKTCYNGSEGGSGAVEQEEGLTIIRQQTQDNCGSCQTTDVYDRVQEFKEY